MGSRLGDFFIICYACRHDRGRSHQIMDQPPPDQALAGRKPRRFQSAFTVALDYLPIAWSAARTQGNAGRTAWPGSDQKSMAMSATIENKRLTTRDIHAICRRSEKLAMLTAYDHVTAGLLDQAGVEIILVGDSFGNVVLGCETTLPVTLDDMIRHASAVYRGTARAMVVCDLPFGTAKIRKRRCAALSRCCSGQDVRRLRSRAAAPRRRS